MMDAFIIDGIRTPIGRFRGSLSTVRTDDLAVLVIKELISRNPNLPTDRINDVILGCHNQAGEDNRNVARMAALMAGLPVSVPGETVNRLCASGMSAVIHAAQAIRAGDGDIYIAGGVENMTRSPWVLSKTSRAYGNDSELQDSSFGWRFVNPLMRSMYGVDPMGITAENLVDKYAISREEQDRYAYESQQRACNAHKSGRLSQEIVPITVTSDGRTYSQFHEDEFLKPDTTVEKLRQLKPAFRANGTVTAGNASGLNDGAIAMYIASEKAVDEYNLQPVARIVSYAVTGVEPRLMGIGPVSASRKALSKAGLSLNDMEVIEINEAFAAQVIACLRELGLSDNDPRLNINGGAIALGHPLGMTGARIVYSAALELKNQRKRYALAALCVGVGQGCAVIIENV